MFGVLGLQGGGEPVRSRRFLLAGGQAKARLDENRDGEPVMRVQLLMTDPDGDTWDLDPVIEMKRALRRKATELDLPFASFTMIAEREPSAKIFA